MILHQGEPSRERDGGDRHRESPRDSPRSRRGAKETKIDHLRLIRRGEIIFEDGSGGEITEAESERSQMRRGEITRRDHRGVEERSRREITEASRRDHGGVERDHGGVATRDHGGVEERSRRRRKRSRRESTVDSRFRREREHEGGVVERIQETLWFPE